MWYCLLRLCQFQLKLGRRARQQIGGVVISWFDILSVECSLSFENMDCPASKSEQWCCAFTITTRTMHVHDASHCASAYVRIAHAGRPWSSRTTTVESNMKSEHNLYLASEDCPQHAFFFCTFSCFCLALLATQECQWLTFLSLSVSVTDTYVRTLRE